jgi:hypothetical protein
MKSPLFFIRIITTCIIPTLFLTIAASDDPGIARQGKEWNFMVYMCNNNNLHRFGIQNLSQMSTVGSSIYANILVQMDELGEKKINRYFIEKDKATIVDGQSNTNTSISGTPANLYDFVQWGIKKYPSKKTCLVLWNHGAGIKDPSLWGRAIMNKRDDFFTVNTKTGLLELNRTFAREKIEKILNRKNKRERGIGFNDVAHTYLTNDDLKKTLDQICINLLDNEKIDVLAMDACHMAMIEVLSQVKTAAKIVVASEEVEPGSGYNYSTALSILKQANISEYTLAKHLVLSYAEEYNNAIGDYTQSAIDLKYLSDLEATINKLSLVLFDIIAKGSAKTLKAVSELRFNHKKATIFLDTDYIDLGHFLKSIIIKAAEIADAESSWLSIFSSENPAIRALWQRAKNISFDALSTLQKMTIANEVGPNLSLANGLAIYFPTNIIHSSYYKTEFAKSTNWTMFLEKFVKAKKNEVAEKKSVAQTKSGKSKGCCCCKKKYVSHKP